MNYNEAKQYLKEVNKYGSVLGLKSITTLLKEMGNPEKSLKVVHIAGTNGKGSTMAFLNSILMEAGYKVGRYKARKPSSWSFLSFDAIRRLEIGRAHV